MSTRRNHPRTCLAVGSHPSEILSLRTSANLFLKRVSIECVRRVASVCSLLERPERDGWAQSPEISIHAFLSIKSVLMESVRGMVFSVSSLAYRSPATVSRPSLSTCKPPPCGKSLLVDGKTPHQPDNSIPCCRAWEGALRLAFYHMRART